MTKNEIELMQDSIIQASNKVELLQKTIIEKAVEIERLKAEYEKLQTNAEILARGVRDLNHENYELTEKIKQTRKETAKEILQEWADDNSSMGLDNTSVKNIAKKYGVEVEE